MRSFVKPKGVCFLFDGNLPAPILSNALCRVTNFLQEIAPHSKLQKYDDWWEHDGLHFYRGSINFDSLYQMINSPKHLLESTPDDDSVFAGVASYDSNWYLRYRVEWNYDETNLVGNFAIVLPHSLAEKFKRNVLEKLDIGADEKDSEAYYQEIIL